jgi:hypothetical protein
MEKEKEGFKEVSAEAQLEQLRVSQDKSSVIKLGNKSIKIRPITCAVADRMSGYLVRQVEISEPTTAELVAKQRPNLKLQCKAVALAILNDGRMNGWFGWLKVNLLHWIIWRKVFRTMSSSDISKIFTHIVEKLQLIFFYQNTALTKGMNTLTKRKTKEEVELLQAEQESEKKEDS